MTEQDRQIFDERIAKTLGISSQEMDEKFSKQIILARTGRFDEYYNQLKAFKEVEKSINSIIRTIEEESTKHLNRSRSAYPEK